MVRKLVWDYPAHEFVIDLTEAKAIGLHAKAMEQDLEDLAWKVVENHTRLFELLRPGAPATTSSTGTAPTVSMVKTGKEVVAASPNGGSDA
jgi:hypothetical protein